jgi:NAD(P)-dependent dehydrogenase (short-subunit alcohol dehydrogenase family)
MTANLENKVALIVGAGSGLSASIARSFAGAGMKIALAARSVDDLGPLAGKIGATTFTADASDREAVKRLFADLADHLGDPYAVVYNASYRTRGPLIDLDPAEVAKSLAVSAFGGFLVAQEAARRMLPKSAGAIFFTGASASVMGYAQSAPFAMGKFALRGLAQSMARELSPQGIHVAHVVVDGGIRSARRPDAADRPDAMLDPDAIAANYLHLLQQHRSAWTWEIEVRPWVEKF